MKGCLPELHFSEIEEALADTFVNAHKDKYLEPSIGFVYSQGVKRKSKYGFTAQSPPGSFSVGARLSANTYALIAYRAELVYKFIKVSGNYILQDKNGKSVNKWGGAIGYGYTMKKGSSRIELVYYNNYLEHLDLVPLFRDMHYFKIAGSNRF